MSWTVIVRPKAESELTEAYDWYEERDEGLGADFLRRVDAVLNTVARNPLLYPVIHRNVRRALTRRFPYEVYFIVDGGIISVLAVMHSRRDPKDWQGRI